MPKLRRPSPSMIVALTALVVALGGTAFAAGVVINGNLLKNGSVTGKKLKRDTLTGTTQHALDLTIAWYADSPSGCTAIAEGVVR